MSTNCANRRARQATLLALNSIILVMRAGANIRQFNGEDFMTFIAKHISVSIDLSAAQVYEFASNPENLPKWAEA
jgi:hypothetical protein